MDGGSQLLATGGTGGGLIQVGGSWQNSDLSVRQAITTQIEQGAVLDASAIVEGDGGEIVVWSDISNPASVTTVGGTLLAKGGRKGGDGGDIETSGFELDVAGIDVDATAREGEQGLWLLDPFDYTLDSTDASTIETVVEAGNNVTISTASALNSVGGGAINADDSSDSTGGTITIDSSITIDSAPSGGSAGSLSFVADKNIIVNQPITTSAGITAGNLVLDSETGVTIPSGGSIDWNPGSSGSVLLDFVPYRATLCLSLIHI